MTYKDNITAILECYFTGFKEEIIDSACNRILEQEPILDKIRAEITDCLKALDEIEKSGFNIYLPNEISGRRLTYQQCLDIIDKYKADVEPQEREGV